MSYRIEKKIAQTNAKIEKIERDKLTKEDLKTVALGTSKINYLDPRITVAWCKRQEVPIEKVRLNIPQPSTVELVIADSFKILALAPSVYLHLHKR